ncbi:MAG: hypothetical protein SynsKO_37450 [Synoicihabitans sp.]
MIYFDVTKSAKSRHASGLMRVNRRLREELGGAITEVQWGKWDPSRASSDDWYLSTEVFDVEKRPGFGEFLERAPCRTAAMFPDAIPLKFPEITWPHSVERHPRYMHTLAKFDHVFAISSAVKRDLIGFWHWQGNKTNVTVSVLPLGADFDGSARGARPTRPPSPSLVCVGIVEPRKNQTFLLDVAEALWSDGVNFELNIVGRVNPHFGKPVVDRMRSMAASRAGLHFHESASDEKFASLLANARAVVFPTIAEGCGLPVLESLWRGLPCVCSDLPVLRENADEGGCVSIPVNNLEAWCDGLRRVLTDDAHWEELANQAATRTLPTWAESAAVIEKTLV